MSDIEREKWIETCEETLQEEFLEKVVDSKVVWNFLWWLEDKHGIDLQGEVLEWKEKDRQGKDLYNGELGKLIDVVPTKGVGDDV